MTTIYVQKMVESDFNTLADLKEIFYANAYNGLALGVKYGDKLATVEQKKIINGVCGWRISYGENLGKAFIAESKAAAPSKFTESLLCSHYYFVEVI